MKKTLFVIFAIMLSSAVIFADSKKGEKEYLADLDAVKEEKIILEAAKWVAKEETKAAVPKLVFLLNDSRETIRLNAAVALGYIGEENAVEPLNKVLLEDRSSDVRYAALLSTVRIGSKKSIDAWIKAKETETDPVILDFLAKMEARAKKK